MTTFILNDKDTKMITTALKSYKQSLKKTLKQKQEKTDRIEKKTQYLEDVIRDMKGGLK